MPVCVLSGILTVSSPSMPGTLISPPSASVVNAQRHRAVQVVAVALEELVLAHEDDDVEIAGRAAERARFAFAGAGAAADRWRCRRESSP